MARFAGRNKVERKALRGATLTTASPDAVAAVAAPTKAEFDKVVTLVNELKADHNALVSALK